MLDNMKVFVSTTPISLFNDRNALIEALLRLKITPLNLSKYDRYDRNALQVRYHTLQQAKIFIGLYSRHHGFLPMQNSSYKTAEGTVVLADRLTSNFEYEYNWAAERNLPMLLFYKVDEYPAKPPPPSPSIADLRHKKFLDTVIKVRPFTYFHNSDDLCLQVLQQLSQVNQSPKNE